MKVYMYYVHVKNEIVSNSDSQHLELETIINFHSSTEEQ